MKEFELGSDAERIGLSGLADTRASKYEQLVAQARASSLARHVLREEERALNASSVMVGVVGVERSHAEDLGFLPKPVLPPRAAAFGLP